MPATLFYTFSYFNLNQVWRERCWLKKESVIKEIKIYIIVTLIIGATKNLPLTKGVLKVHVYMEVKISGSSQKR